MNLASVIGQTLDDKYLIERQLGKGGMGAVFLATHVGTGRNVAVKIIMPQFMAQDEFIERFRREARAAGRLRHPNVVDVTDFGFAQLGKERVAYLVMEYLDGCTLDEVLEEEERLPVSWVVDILEQTCSAVDEAHQQGIIHRDLKPDNIWLEPNRRGGYTVKVLDFGIAKLEESAGQERDPEHDSSARTLIGQVAGIGSAPRSSSVSEYAATLITGADAAAASTNVDAEGAGGLGAARARIAPTEFSEGDTLLTPETAAPPAVEENAREGATKLFGTKYTDERDTFSTSAHSSLTRVGALLGTPLYMSPEQCHGKPLDARTDVYSLGVIAYRMLSGKTPFSGNPTTVMQQHKEEPPPPLVARRTPKKLRRVVMSALAKDPAERPANAAAFANSVRAYSEGVGQLIQSGLLLFLQHFRTFLRLSFLVYAPMIVVTIVQTSLGSLEFAGVISKTVHSIISGTIGVVTFPVQLFTAYVVSAVTTWLVVQALGAPLRPLQLRPAFAALWRRKWPFVGTIFLMVLCFIVGALLPAAVGMLAKFTTKWLALWILPACIPLLIVFFGFALAVPALMMENVSGIRALKRSLELSRRAKRTVFATVLIHFLIPVFVASGTGGVIFAVLKALKVEHALGLANLAFPLVWLPAQIFLGGIAAVITAVLYLKTRQAGGEPVRVLLRDLESADRPQTRWQQRMREKLTASSRTTH